MPLMAQIKKAEAPKKETTSNENGNSKGPNKPNMTNSNEKIE